MINKKAFRNKVANYIFNREMRGKKRQPQSVPFNEARTIGIIYEATDDKDYEIVKNYVKIIRDQKKDVLALGYIDQKELPYMRFAKLGLDFFTQKNLTWHLRPNSPVASKFMSSNFDILINLTIEKCFPLKYVAAATKAKFKIGKYDKKNSSFTDFMIKTDDNISLQQFIEIVNRYLRVFSGEHVQEV